MKLKNIVLLVLVIIVLGYFYIFTPLTTDYFGLPFMNNSRDITVSDLIFLWIGIASFTMLLFDIISNLIYHNDDSIRDLNNRLSNGEITTQEYKELKKDQFKK